MIPFLYALVTVVATLVGGLLSLSGSFAKMDLRYLVAFAAGGLVSIAFFDMIPEGAGQHASLLAAGFFAIYLLEKLILIHTCGEAECETHTIGWVALIGIVAESLIDGLGIGAGYALNPGLGLGIAAAVFLHELPRGFSTAVIMRQAGYRQPLILLSLLADALPTPVGALLSGVFPDHAFQRIVAFAAGTFLYIGAGDLLPEAHRRFNMRVVLSLLLGAALVPLLSSLARL